VVLIHKDFYLKNNMRRGFGMKICIIKPLRYFIIISFLITGHPSFTQEPAHLLTKLDKQALVFNLERIIPDLMEKAVVPGLSIAVIRDGEILWHKGYGVKNIRTKEPLTDNTVFNAASLTKPLLGYLALKMVEKGELDLDKPMIDYVPLNYLEKMFIRHSIDMEGFKSEWFKKITARMVLSHSSGLPNDYEGEKPHPVLFEPGTRFRYSFDGLYLFQLVIENIKNESFGQVMKTYILEPLGMKNSSMVWEDRYETQCASGHNKFGETDGEFRKYYSGIAPISLYTNAEDYAKFIVAVMNDSGLEKKSVLEMLTPQVKAAENISWSIGFGIEHTENGDAFWQWGDFGIFQNYVIAFKKQKIGLVYFTNSGNGLSICQEIIRRSIGGGKYLWQSWQDYKNYDTPQMQLVRVIAKKGVDEGIKLINEMRLKIPEAVGEDEIISLGNLLLNSGKYKEGIEILKFNRDTYPQSKNIILNLAEAYLRNGEDNPALLNYKKVLELDSKNKTAQIALKMFQFMKVLSERGAKDAASFLFELNRKSPDDYSESLLSGFGYTLLQAQRTNEAIQLFIICTELFPGSSLAYENLGEAHKRQENYELAIKNYKKSLELDPGNLWAAVYLERLERKQTLH